MVVRWLTVFMDRPDATFDAAADFWQAVTGTERSAARGDRGQFATLLPPAGDPHIRVQRIDDGSGGTHLDLHSDDSTGLVDRAVRLGATVVGDDPVWVLRSPGGYVWCVVAWHGESDVSRPHVGPSGAPSRLDQLCLDISPSDFDAEVTFWGELLGWPVARSTSRPEFAVVARPDGIPIRLLLQRIGDSDRSTTGHFDLAAGDRVSDVVVEHVEAGASAEPGDWPWTVMVDPSGHRYCVTPRDPFGSTR